MIYSKTGACFIDLLKILDAPDHIILLQNKGITRIPDEAQRTTLLIIIIDIKS